MERIDLSAAYSPVELAIHSCRYLPAKSMVAGKKVLDIACGEGIGVGLLLQWGAAEVVGIDISKTAIDAAEEAYRDHDNVRFVCEDALTYLENTDEEFEVVVSVETVEHVPDPEAFLKALGALRAKGASVVISCPNDYFYFGRGPSLNPYHVTQFSFYDFRTMAERHLGEAEWYLGTPNTGFAAVHMDATKRMTRDYVKGIDLFETAEAGTMPGFSGGHQRLAPSNSLFYLGIWADEEEISASYQTSFPTSAHYRLPRIINVSDDVAVGRTRRVAFVIDMRDWAFDNIVRNMQPFLEGRYHISFFYVTEHADWTELFEKVFVKGGFDNVHVMWRELIFNFLSGKHALTALLAKTGLEPSELAELIARPVLTTSVYDHLFLREEDVEERQAHFKLMDGYSVSSQRLLSIYNQSFLTKPTIEIADGVNLDFFAPARDAQAKRVREDGQTIQIGWVGNSKWGSDNPSVSEDPKGLHSVLLPAVERLSREGYPVELALADRNIKQRSREEMVDYYGEIDILVCASLVEGTPNPVLEAMASGIPFVSTDVGIVREAAGPLQSEFILEKRTPYAMYQKLKMLLDNPDTYQAVAEENRESVKDWAWGKKTPKWLNLFAKAEETHKARGYELRKAILEARLQKWVDEAELYRKLNQKNAEIERVRNRVTELNAELATRADTLMDVRQKLKTVREAKDDWKAKAEANWNELQPVKQERDGWKAKAETQGDELQSLNADRDDWKSKAEANWRDLQALKEHKKRIDEEYEALSQRLENELLRKEELREVLEQRPSRRMKRTLEKLLTPGKE